MSGGALIESLPTERLVLEEWLKGCGAFIQDHRVDITETENGCKSMSVEYTVIPYDLIDDDLDFDELAYSNFHSSFLNQLHEYLMTLMKYQRKASNIKSCHLLVKSMLSRTKIIKDKELEITWFPDEQQLKRVETNWMIG